MRPVEGNNTAARWAGFRGMRPIISVFLLAAAAVVVYAASGTIPSQPGNVAGPTYPESEPGKYLMTFVELGSVSCIPCQKMQPIMKEIEQEYAGKVRVVFYDVWQDRRPAEHYGINIIPTQVFLDRAGKEFFRHQGFFPKEEIVKLIKTKGVM